MLQRHSYHRSRPTTPFSSCSSSKPNSTKSIASRFSGAKQLAKASRSATVRCDCIHKEYARQGSTPAQQEAPAGAAGNAAGQQLLSVPEDIVLECLTILRRGELSGLAPYLPDNSLAPQGAPVMLAGVPVHEQGPLARCAPFMDTAARRVLPGHLLRRARVLSSFQVGGSCLLRVALTACTGEETVLVWKLALTGLPGIQQQQQQQSQPQQDQQQQLQDSGLQQQVEQEQEQVQAAQHPDVRQQQDTGPNRAHNSITSSSSSQGPRACWRIVSVAQEAFSEDQHELPRSPHPRTPPELIVRAQLQALRQQQLLKACGFNLMGRHASSSGWEAHLTAFKQLLQQPCYRLLGEHTVAELGASALPSQRQFLQEVVLLGPNSSSSSSSSSGSSSVHAEGGSSRLVGEDGDGVGRFLWRLGMQADGCWMVRSIEVL